MHVDYAKEGHCYGHRVKKMIINGLTLYFFQLLHSYKVLCCVMVFESLSCLITVITLCGGQIA